MRYSNASLAITLLAAAAGAAEPAAEPLPIERLAWLSGCWQSLGGEPGSGEQWTPPAGDTLLGTSRTVRGGRTVAYEFLRIRRLDDGRLAYVALPSGQRETTFPLLAAGERSAVFENLDHDFPQRVLYTLEEGGALRARIEGTDQGRSRAVDFPLRRIDCEGSVVEPESRE
ncbi:MAG TPA: DUF6265 family protein [Thermoanaerobaculia bacterium]|jgi:hypothetical protein